MLQGDLDVLLNREEFVIFIQSRVLLGPGKFHVVVLVIFISLEESLIKGQNFKTCKGQLFKKKHLHLKIKARSLFLQSCNNKIHKISAIARSLFFLSDSSKIVFNKARKENIKSQKLKGNGVYI